jgi:hypothetical protein
MARLPDLRSTRTQRVARLLAIYLFALVLGQLGGRIIVAAHLYTALGWTAMWIEIGTWGPAAPTEHQRLASGGSARG